MVRQSFIIIIIISLIILIKREKLLDAMLYAAVSIVETCPADDDQLLDLAMRKLYFFWVTSLVPGRDMWNRFGVCKVNRY